MGVCIYTVYKGDVLNMTNVPNMTNKRIVKMKIRENLSIETAYNILFFLLLIFCL